MSQGYVPVQWNSDKKKYDLYLWLGVILYIVVFMGVSSAVFKGVAALSPAILLIRAFGSCAFLLLTMVLCIGPLARLDKRFLPILYNRRHLGVSTFLVTLIHGIIVTVWYNGFGVINPFKSLVSAHHDYGSLAQFPFEILGIAALFILLIMAATSHDYWNKNLGPSVWKSLHMFVYIAYGLTIAHIALGALQTDFTGFLPIMGFLSVLIVGALHLAAAFRENRNDLYLDRDEGVNIGHVNIGPWQTIENNQAITVAIDKNEKVAVYRYDGNKLAAISNVCKHQLGPLGEGKVIDGCITCPWHGYQYRPDDGQSPPPYTEKISTYHVSLDGDDMLLDPNPLPEGTARPVTLIPNTDKLTAEANAS